MLVCRDARAPQKRCARPTQLASSVQTARGTPTLQASGTLVMEVSVRTKSTKTDMILLQLVCQLKLVALQPGKCASGTRPGQL